MDLIEQIKALILEKFASDADYADCFILEVGLKPGNRLEVTLDSDSGITFQICQRVSRHLEAVLDEKEWLGESYVLEVGSAGATRPLELPRQYVKAIGRELKIKLADGNEVEGLVTAADDHGVTLQFEEVRKEGKKKIKEILTPVYPYAEIKKAVVKLKF